MSDETREGVRLAEDEVSGRLIAAVAVATAIIVALAIAWVYFALERRVAALGGGMAQPQTTVIAPGPGGILATPIALDRAGQRARREDAEALERYGWVDRERGIIRIPISRAIDVVTMTAGDARTTGEDGR